MEQLRALSDMAVDERLVDDFNINFPSQMLCNHAGHPFYALPYGAESPCASPF